MRRSRLLIVLLAVALAVRLAAAPIGLRQAETRGLVYFDEYGGIAKNIVEGKGFSYHWYGATHPTSIHAPAYPYILAGLFSLFGFERGGALAVLLFNILLSILFLYFVFRCAVHLFGALPGLITLAILALYPSQIYYGASGLPTVLYEGMLLLVLFFAWRLREDPSYRRSLAWGISIGAAALSYTFALLLAPFLALWIVISAGSSSMHRYIGPIAAAALIAALICTPWTIRNYRVHGRWVPVRDQAGTNLWWGNGPLATGGAIASIGHSLKGFPEEIAAALEAIPNEVDQDRYLGDLAVEYMREHPVMTLRLWALKLWNFWWIHTGMVAAASGLGRFMPLIKLARGLLLAASGVGIVLLWPSRRRLVVLGLLCLAAVSVIFMITLSGKIRYFTPLEPILAMAAGYAIARGLELIGCNFLKHNRLNNIVLKRRSSCHEMV